MALHLRLVSEMVYFPTAAPTWFTVSSSRKIPAHPSITTGDPIELLFLILVGFLTLPLVIFRVQIEGKSIH